MAGDGLVVSQPEECAIFIFHITRDATKQCPPNVFDVAFVDNERVLAWDPDCSAVYQIDTAKNVQLLGDTIDLGFPLGEQGLIAPDLFNQLSFSAVTGKAFLVRDSQLAVIDPNADTSYPVGTFQGTPILASLAPGGRSLYIAVRQQPAAPDQLALYQYDPKTKVFSLTQQIYTFKPPMSVRDFRILAPWRSRTERPHRWGRPPWYGAYIPPWLWQPLTSTLAGSPPGTSVLSPQLRDALMSILLTEIAGHIHEEYARVAIQRDALQLLIRQAQELLHALGSKSGREE